MSNQWKLKLGGGWHQRPRAERLAAVMYPDLTDAETQREMAQLARNEGRRPPFDAEFRSNKPVKSRDPFKLRSK
jgi:hypothetical protein